MFFKRKRLNSTTAVFRAINKDLARAARRARTQVRTIEDTRTSLQSYPELVPVLASWLATLDTATNLDEAANAMVRDALYRSLTTKEAPSDLVVDDALTYLNAHPHIGAPVSSGAANAACFHAQPHHIDVMTRTARNRELGESRAFILEWLVQGGDEDALRVVLEQLDDPSVQVWVLSSLTKLRRPPEFMRSTIAAIDTSHSSRAARLQEKILRKLG